MTLIALLLLLAACGGDVDDTVVDVEPDDDVTADADPTEVADDDDDDAVSDASIEGCEDVEGRIAHNSSGDSPGHIALETFAEELSSLTDGRVSMEVFPGGQLGTIAEYPELVATDAIQVAWIDAGSLSTLVPDTAAMLLPFMFDSGEEFHQAMDGEAGELLADMLRDTAGLEVLWWMQSGQFYPFFAGEAPTTPDWSGLDIRATEAPIYIQTLESFGANVVGLPFGDVYTAVQTGAVDGFTLPIWSVPGASLDEVVDTMLDLPFMTTSNAIATSTTFLDGLCAHDAEAVRAAGEVAMPIERAGWVEYDEENLQQMVDDGLEVVQPEDVDAFREATQQVRDDFEASFDSDVVNIIQRELGRD